MKQSIKDLILFIILLGVIILIGWKLGEVINQLINENRNFGEDLEFNILVKEYNPSFEYIDTDYYYNYGINNNCISYKYARDEISEFKEGSDV